METKNKQPEYSRPEAEAKIRKYGRISKGLFAIGIAGLISAVSPVPPIFQEYNKPEISEIYQDAETAIQILQYKKNNLSKKFLNFSYTTPEIEEAREFFNKEYNEGNVKLNKSIESVQNDISKIESNSEYKQYQQDKKTKKTIFGCLYFGGLLAFLGGVVGSAIVEKQKRNLEAKLQNESFRQPENQQQDWNILGKKYLKELNSHL
ncbi:MAG: hypothetical protein ABIF18_03420 [archaeon]